MSRLVAYHLVNGVMNRIEVKVFEFFAKSNLSQSKEKQIRYNLLSFSEDEHIVILNKILTYICVSGNESTFDFLFKFILTVNGFNVISRMNFDMIKDYQDERITCLKVMKSANNEEDIRSGVFPLLKNDHVQNFLYQLITNVNMPPHFAPLYLYFLKSFRKKGGSKRYLHA